MDNCSRSSNSSTWGLALSTSAGSAGAAGSAGSAGSDGRTDPEADLFDSTEAVVSAPFPPCALVPCALVPCTREQLYSQLQGLQQELYQVQELQRLHRLAEQSYGHSTVELGQVGDPGKPSTVDVQRLQQQLQQQQMQMMQITQQIEQIRQTLPRATQPLPQAPCRPAVAVLGPSCSPLLRVEEMSTKEVPQKKAVLQPQTPDKPFYNEHGVDLMKLSDSELEKVVPLNANGERTSIGALQHPDKCSRCIFWFRNVCEKGIRCEFCHFTHPGQIAKKIRPSKSVRLKQKEQEKREA